jgi:hypothetical protein
MAQSTFSTGIQQEGEFIGEVLLKKSREVAFGSELVEFGLKLSGRGCSKANNSLKWYKACKMAIEIPIQNT